jgi:hypothetical protein
VNVVGADALAQRVVAPVAEHRDRVESRCPVDQGVAEPVRDDAQVLDLPLAVAAAVDLAATRTVGGDAADIEATVSPAADSA